MKPETGLQNEKMAKVKRITVKINFLFNFSDGTLLKDKFAQYKCSANDVIEFKLSKYDDPLEI